jgi:class 3 adenylate cyclase
VKFRYKIFLAVLLPSSALVAAAVGTALYHLAHASEETAREELGRTAKAFKQVIEDHLSQLKLSSASFAGPRFDAAVSEAVASGDLATVQQLLDYQFQLIGGAPNFYELRSKEGKVLLRKSILADVERAPAGPPLKWISEREDALTEIAGHPFLMIRFEHEKGTLVIGKHLTESLRILKNNFAVEVALLRDKAVVYSSYDGWKPGETYYPSKKRWIEVEATPGNSEMAPVLFIKGMDEVDRDMFRVLAVGVGGFVVSVLVAILVSIMVSRGMSKPIEVLVEAARKIAAGDYKVQVQVTTRDEIGDLSAAFNDMTDGLRKRQEIMDKTLSRDVAEEFLKGTDRRPDRRIVTIVFMDIRGYTSGTEGMDPGDVVVMLNELMDLLSSAIVRNGGIVNKFLGDGLMAMFGAPKPLEGHALKAVRAGLEMQKWMARWNDRRIARGMPAFFSGIGINTGYAMCGKVGAQDRMEYTLIGEEVNLASRICGKAAPKQVLVTKQTWDLVQDEMKGRELEPVTVKGLSYPIKVFEVLE